MAKAIAVCGYQLKASALRDIIRTCKILSVLFACIKLYLIHITVNICATYDAAFFEIYHITACTIVEAVV